MKLAPLIAAVLLLCLPAGTDGRKPKPTSCTGKNKEKYPIGKGYLDTKTCIQYTCVKKKGKLKMVGKKMPKPCTDSPSPPTPIPSTTIPPPLPPGPGLEAMERKIEALQENVTNILKLITNMQSTSNKLDINITTNMDDIKTNKEAIAVNKQDISTQGDSIARNKNNLDTHGEDISKNKNTCSAVEISAQHLGTCLADINSPDCPASGRGKKAMTDAINDAAGSCCEVIAGGWSDWSEFSECSATCGSATKKRERTCTNPPPSNGGAPCPGSNQEIVDCALQDCPGEKTCPEGWTSLSTGCYKFIAGGTHQQVTTNCENEGGFLIEIDDQEEQDAAFQFYKDQGISEEDIYLGATDVAKEGEWIWSHSGKKMTFTAWNTGEPNDYGTGEDCLTAYTGGNDFKWNDVPCSHTSRGLCERPTCPNGWTTLATGCYKFSAQGTHQQVTTNCENEGGFLIEIDNQEEQDAAFQFVQDEGKSSQYIWLGATDITTEGEWIWTHSGNKMTFTAWLPGSPTNGTGQDCLEAQVSNNFKWNDWSCAASAYGLCEIATVTPPTPTPTPTPTPAPSPSCPAGWTSLTTGCYKFIALGNYEQVTTNCKNEGGFLIEINNQEEQDAVLQFYKDEEITDNYIWLGATDITTEGEWIWSHSGNKMTYTAWIISQPSNATDENCVEAHGNHNLKWADYYCHYKGRGLCEHVIGGEITPTPSPAPPPPPPPPACPVGWTSLTTGCYKFIAAGTHKQVTTNCENEGGFLIEINNQEEQDAAFQFYKDEGISYSYIWLGATDVSEEGEWIWSHSGNKMTFTAWITGQPSNKTSRNCLEARGNNDFKWGDWSCGGFGSGLCERPTSQACGIENIDTKISGGNVTNPNQYPWMVHLSIGCGGSLITDRHVLTAKHCVDFLTQTNWAQLKVKVGVHNKDDPLDFQEVSVKYPPKYPNVQSHDIAIITLEQPVNLNDKTIGTVCLPASVNEDYRGKTARVMGWGRSDDNNWQASKFLQHVDVTVSQKDYKNWLLTDIVFQNGIPLDACKGDSGGPLVYKETTQWTVIGTVSSGELCNTHGGGDAVYAKVTDFIAWIKSVI